MKHRLFAAALVTLALAACGKHQDNPQSPPPAPSPVVVAPQPDPFAFAKANSVTLIWQPSAPENARAGTLYDLGQAFDDAAYRAAYPTRGANMDRFTQAQANDYGGSRGLRDFMSPGDSTPSGFASGRAPRWKN